MIFMWEGSVRARYTFCLLFVCSSWPYKLYSLPITKIYISCTIKSELPSSFMAALKITYITIFLTISSEHFH